MLKDHGTLLFSNTPPQGAVSPNCEAKCFAFVDGRALVSASVIMFRRAVDEMNRAILNYVSNEMKTYIYMLRTGMVLMILR